MKSSLINFLNEDNFLSVMNNSVLKSDNRMIFAFSSVKLFTEGKGILAFNLSMN